MESCQKYTADDQKPNPEDYLNRSKKDSDFDKLTRKFQDNENLSQIEKDRLLQEIRNWIKCDINLSLLEAQKNPNQKNYHKSRQILFIAQQY